MTDDDKKCCEIEVTNIVMAQVVKEEVVESCIIDDPDMEIQVKTLNMRSPPNVQRNKFSIPDDPVEPPCQLRHYQRQHHQHFATGSKAEQKYLKADPDQNGSKNQRVLLK